MSSFNEETTPVVHVRADEIYIFIIAVARYS